MLEEVGAEYETILLSAGDPWGGTALKIPKTDGRSKKARFSGRSIRLGRYLRSSMTVMSSARAERSLPISPMSSVGEPSSPEPIESRLLSLDVLCRRPGGTGFTNKRARFVPLAEKEFFFDHGSFERTLNQLEFAVTLHPFIAGERFTAADVYVGSHIGWGLGPGTNPPREAFVKYAGNLVSRDAYKRSVEPDNALLQKG